MAQTNHPKLRDFLNEVAPSLRENAKSYFIGACCSQMTEDQFERVIATVRECVIEEAQRRGE